MVKSIVGFGIAAIFLASGAADAQTKVQVTGTTATQAVLSYIAPDGGACRVEVSESTSLQPLVHDVNGTLFPSANFDNRPGAISSGTNRVVVIGKRVAEKATDGNRYSRALQAGTNHYYAIRCGTTAAAGIFRTKDIPLGGTWGDPLPAAEDRPGEYGYPTVPWADRKMNRAVDPLTGLQLHRISAPGDRTDNQTGEYKDARAADNSWINPGAAVNSNDGGAYAASSGNSRGFLFLDTKFKFYRGGSYDAQGQSLSAFRTVLNAWCVGTTCQGAPEEARTLEFCLTVDGQNCSTEVRTRAVEACSVDCANTSKVEIGDMKPLMSFWGADPRFDITHAHARSGVVSRQGNTVRWVGGNKFSLRWTAGSHFVINGRVQQIARVDNEETLTLADAQSGEEKEVPYEATNFGLLVRRKSVTGVQFAVGSGNFEVGVGDGADWDASGDGENLFSCSEKTVAGPEGEQGYHCTISYSVYWIGQTSGTVSRLGTAVLPDNGANGADGWNKGFCLGMNWDPADADVFYCKGVDKSAAPNEIILRGRYKGNNQDLGDLPSYESMTDCRTSASPCFEFTNITPGSQGRGLLTQLRSLLPEAANFRTRGFDMAGRQSKYMFMMARRDWGNDLSGILAALDLTTGKIVAAVPSWKNWPLRWGGFHGPSSVGDPEWAFVPVTQFRGPATGGDWAAGNGPYRSQILSGAIGTAGQPCPDRPAGSKISAADWPSGNDCLKVTVDGEPCDPSPAVYMDGKVRVQAGDAIITGLGTYWVPFYDGSQLMINGKLYTFSYVSATSARVSPTPTESFEGSYSLVLEPIGNSKCGSTMHTYLQDAEPGDIFCINPDGTSQYCHGYGQTEWVRLLRRDQNTWHLQRKMGLGGQAIAVKAGSYLIAYPSTCPLAKDSPCAVTHAYWNFVQDPFAKNASGKTVYPIQGETNGSHTSMKPGLEVYAVASDNCPSIDGQGYTCYGYRRGTLPSILTQSFELTSNNPAFGGRLGMGTPNAVESHPTVPVLSGAGTDNKNWFLDARPMLGADNFSGSPERPATRIEGDLYRFAPDQMWRMRRKEMPTMASCGSSVLRDISGPGSSISGGAASAYTYCVAEKNGECDPQSSVGEVYVNCPQVSRAYCQSSGIGDSKPDMRDICIGDNGAYTQGIVQVGVNQSGLAGTQGRVLTNGFARYRLNDHFWNAKMTPDGQWMFVRSRWYAGQRTEVFAAKLPPLITAVVRGTKPRNDFYSTPLSVTPPPELNASGVVVEFGYTPEYYCTSRRDACIKGAQAGNDYTFASLPAAPVPCQGGCSVSVPLLPNRVAYWRARYFSADGREVGASAPTAAAVY